MIMADLLRASYLAETKPKHGEMVTESGNSSIGKTWLTSLLKVNFLENISAADPIKTPMIIKLREK